MTQSPPIPPRQGGVPSLKARALRCLAQREYTRFELARKLAPHVLASDDLEVLLDALTAQGWLSDTRAAGSLVRRLAPKQGVQRIRQQLKEKGVDSGLANEALDGLLATELERAVGLWQRKFGGPPADVKAQARQIRFLLARGFEAGLVRQVVGRVQEHRTEPDDEGGVQA